MRYQLEQSVKILNSEGLLVYPTDTVWGIGCDATNAIAVSKIFRLKKRASTKSMIVLVTDIDMLQNYLNIELSTSLLQKIQNFEMPTTVIYNYPKNIAKNLIATDDTLAIRIVQDDFCKKLISKFGKPIVSTSANISQDPTPLEFKEINPLILEGVDYVVNLHRQKKATKASTILKLDLQGHLKILRP